MLARYRELVLHELPRRARAQRRVVTADHCFGRIVLDHAVGGAGTTTWTGAARRPSPSSTTSASPRPSRSPSGSPPRATRSCASPTPAAWPGPARCEAVPPVQRPGR